MSWKFFTPELLRQILDDDRRLDVNDFLRLGNFPVSRLWR